MIIEADVQSTGVLLMKINYYIWNVYMQKIHKHLVCKGGSFEEYI